MIFHTVLPDFVVFEDEEGLEESVKKQKYMEFGGRHLLIEPVSDESYKVVRLVSSDPQDYLDTRYQPGNILSMKPQI